MITMTHIMLNINSPGAKEPKSVVNLFITIIMDPAGKYLPKKAARGQNDGWPKIFSRIIETKKTSKF